MSKYFLVDCDGVLLNWTLGFQLYLEEVYPKYKIDLSVYDYGLEYNLLSRLVDEFNTTEHFSRLPDYSDAKIGIAHLANTGYNIVVITSCLGTQKTVDLRQKNLVNIFGDVFHKIICIPHGESKKEILRQYPNSYWVDDTIRHCVDGNDLGHTSILMSHSYNQNDVPSNMLIAKTWKDIIEIIKT